MNIQEENFPLNQDEIPLTEFGSLGILAYGASGIIAWKKMRNESLLWKKQYLKLFKTENPDKSNIRIKFRDEA